MTELDRLCSDAPYEIGYMVVIHDTLGLPDSTETINRKNPQRSDNNINADLDCLQKRLADLRREHEVSIHAGLNPNYRTRVSTEIELTKTAIAALETSIAL